MLLREFAGGEEERLRAIREYYSAGDWENYGILVHAAKSSSRMIGAETLSQKAAALERAAAEKDTGFIRQSQDAFEALYRETAGAARRAAGMPEDAAGPEDGVLEFAPGEK
jgi:HPt (histidine-containing phosphotransfer) domain-containing protein